MAPDRFAYEYDFYTRTGRKPPFAKVTRLALILVLLGVFVLSGMVFTGILTLDRLYSLVPWVPHTLKALEISAGDKVFECLPDQPCIIRPSDPVRVLRVRSNSPLNLGFRLISSDIDADKLKIKALSFQDMLPQMNFDQPVTETITVMWFRWVIGKVQLTVKWGVGDWIQKAQKAGSVDDKIWFLLKAVEEDPEHVIARLKLAELLFAEGDFSGALNHYQKLAEKGPTRPILERIVDCNKKLNRTDGVVDSYMLLLKNYPDPQYFKAFVSYLKSGMPPDKAKKYAQKALAELPPSFRPSLWLFLTDLCSKVEDWSCVARYSELARQDLGSKDTNLIYNLGIANWKQGNYKQAIAYLEQYLSRNPDDSSVLAIIGECYDKVGDSKGALEFYGKLARKNKDKASIARWISAAEKAGDSEALSEAYNLLAKSQPSDPVAWYNLGVLAYKNKKPDEALAAFEKAYSLKPDDPKPLRYIRKIYHEKNDRDREIEAIKKLIALDPKDIGLYEDYFELIQKNKGIDKASEEILRSCVSSIPGNPRCHEMLLYVLLKNNKKNEAASTLDELIKLKPNNPELLLQKAKLSYSIGRFKETLAALQKYLELRPDDREAKELYMQTRMKLLKSSSH